MEFAALRKKLMDERDLDIDFLVSDKVKSVVESRMRSAGISRVTDYVKRLDHDPGEFLGLIRDIAAPPEDLSGDRYLRRLLETRILPLIIARKQPGQDIRAWIVQCGSGRLVLDLAGLVVKLLGEEVGNYNVRVFGTDSDEANINAARNKRLREETVRQAAQEPGKARQLIRGMIIYGVHDPAVSPPYHNVDLIICRGYLPLLEAGERSQVISRLIYSLVFEGVMILGRGEAPAIGAEAPTRDRPFSVFTKKLPHPSELAALVRAAQPPVSGASLARLHVPAFVVDASGRIIAANAGAVQRALFPEGEIAGRNIREISLGTLVDGISRALVDARSSGQITSIPASDGWLGAALPLPEAVGQAGAAVVVLLPTDVEGVSQDQAIARILEFRARLARDVAATAVDLLVYMRDVRQLREQAAAMTERLYDRSESLNRTRHELEVRNQELQSVNWVLRETQDELQRRAEEAEEGQRILGALMEHVPEGIAIVDASDGRIRMRSKYADEVTGVGPAEGLTVSEVSDRLGGYYHADGVTPAKREELPTLRALGKGEVIRNEDWVLRRPDGVDVPLQVNVGPIRDQEGNVTAAVITFRDVAAIEAARKVLEESLEREHRIAQTLQRALLPRLRRRFDGISLAASYKPAFPDAMVGGDFYHAERLSDDRLLLVLGDVAGKGLEAAVLGSMTKYMLLGFMSENPAPDVTLARLNDALTVYSTEVGFVTLVYLLIDMKSDAVRYGSAGHEPVIHLRSATGEPELLQPTGRALGVQRGAAYQVRELSLEVGDVLVAYTDGLSDAGVPGRPIGSEGLARLVAENASERPSRILRALYEAAIEAAGGRLRDDAASVLVRRDEQRQRIGPRA